MFEDKASITAHYGYWSQLQTCVQLNVKNRFANFLPVSSSSDNGVGTFFSEFLLKCSQQISMELEGHGQDQTVIGLLRKLFDPPDAIFPICCHIFMHKKPKFGLGALQFLARCKIFVAMKVLPNLRLVLISSPQMFFFIVFTPFLTPHPHPTPTEWPHIILILQLL